ncbi:lactate racemase domain-containing protein [candidate division NPL-UPA2 bacterium]|nr:lactate racemase domain-containing protein [candidate division NPL-UPA2 bacterium]
MASKDMTKNKVSETECLSEEEVKEISESALSEIDFKGKKVLVLIPDRTRTAPLPLFYQIFSHFIGKRAKSLNFLIASGTHPPLSEEEIDQLLGRDSEEREARRIFNHHWNDLEQLKEIGKISADEIEEISGGLFREEVRISVNKLIFEYDFLIIISPTFPHEVVGFSGGNKYFFPGISGPEILHFFHWLGAVITNPVINGTKWTPVRKIIDKAASMIKVPRICFSLVVTSQGLKGIFIGSPEEAYSQAANLSAKVHIIYKEKPYKKVLSMAPEMYEDLWTAGKCMYKLEPVVADGGELIIYAPHIKEVSYVHGKILDRIGYHTRDYFLKQMSRFRDVPRGVMAHSTHVKGIGTYENGKERPRIEVILATGIPAQRCRRINLGYRDPQGINPRHWENKEDEGMLLVRQAGEMLYRLK